MNSIRRLLSLSVWIVILNTVTLYSQHVPSRERVDPTLRRRTEIDGNNVRTSVFNFVFSGRTGAGQGIPYEWPKNTGRVYVALIALFVGGEVVDDNGITKQIVEVPAYRQSPTGKDWNLNPLPGYFNPTVGKIAKSDEPNTWPSSWPDKLDDPRDPGWSGSWNGYFGKNKFNADQEMFYRVGDDNYDRHLYTPDTTDRSRRGLGMMLDVRAMEWSQASVADAVFFIQAFKNDGTKDIKKAGVTLWLADFVGGDGDSQDDTPNFDLIRDIAFSFDSDGISSFTPFQGTCVGAAATLYLETPGNAEDRIDNDGDSPETDTLTFYKMLTNDFLLGRGGFPTEIPGNGIDDNHNGLVDEDSTYIRFGAQRGVTFADGIDNNNNGETGSHVITQLMIDQAATDSWKRWPPNPELDPFMQGTDGKPIIHLVDVEQADLGKRYKDNIDNNNNYYSKNPCLNIPDLPVVTQAMIDTAATDPNHRYKVPGTNVILYDLDSTDLGKHHLNKDRLRDVAIDEGIDEMIDESRNDGIDNDGDWRPVIDDVGLDGVPNTGDCGEGDGYPTSGVGTPFPGEPNTDKVDVVEADQIGLTNVQYLPAGAVNFSTTADAFFWQNFMVPGSFVDPNRIGVGEFDLFVSSGLFPMRAGQIERISYAVVMGNASHCPYRGDPDKGGARTDVLAKREYAQLAYNEDYQFAQAPLEPKVTAVAGARIIDGKIYPNKPQVALYWNDAAERSIDGFLQGLGAPAQDFEGYRIYRSTDPAFEDARIIFDAQGNPAPWLKPIAQFDLKNGIKGLHSVDYNGVKFDLGNDTGLKHSWVDTTVQYGQKYYYAVRAYDRGVINYPLPNQPGKFLNVTPAESNLRLSIDNVTGKVLSIGSAVAIITPEAPVAGYVPPAVPIKLVSGSTTGFVGYNFVDPTKVKENHTYHVTFEHIRIPGSTSTAPDTFRTKNFTLTDVTNTSALDTLINRSIAFEDTVEQPLTDGFRLIIRNEKIFGVNPSLSRWNKIGIKSMDFKQFHAGLVRGEQRPNDYKIVFGPVGFDTSVQFRIGTTNLPSRAVNFKVLNTSENKEVDFAFSKYDSASGQLDRSSTPAYLNTVKRGIATILQDGIIFLEKKTSGDTIITWSFSLGYDSLSRIPTTGDTATIVLSKLFRGPIIDPTSGDTTYPGDVFEFITKAQHVDVDFAKSDLDKIKVVPNPYVVTATWEETNPIGRRRSIHFTHLPQQCTIRIFTINGELVKTLKHDSSLLNGTEEWDLLTRDNLTVSYGVYIYHVDAPGIGEKIGKFAVIK